MREKNGAFPLVGLAAFARLVPPYFLQFLLKQSCRPRVVRPRARRVRGRPCGRLRCSPPSGRPAGGSRRRNSAGLGREWALCAKPSILSAGGLPLDYEVARRATVDEFPARLPEPGVALGALADALDLGDDLANLRFEGEDDEWRMELGRFRVAGKPAAFAVVASW